MMKVGFDESIPRVLALIIYRPERIRREQIPSSGLRNQGCEGKLGQWVLSAELHWLKTADVKQQQDCTDE